LIAVACFLPGRAMDLSAPRSIYHVHEDDWINVYDFFDVYVVV